MCHRVFREATLCLVDRIFTAPRANKMGKGFPPWKPLRFYYSLAVMFRKTSFTCSGLQPSGKGASVFLLERKLVRSCPDEIPYLFICSATELWYRAKLTSTSDTCKCQVVAECSQTSSLGNLQQPSPPEYSVG